MTGMRLRVGTRTGSCGGNLKRIFFLLLVPLLVCSCAGTANFRRPIGDKLTVTLRQPSIHDGEALAVSDSLLYLDVDGQVCAARLSDVERVYVHGYKVGPLSRWFWGSTLFLASMGVAVAILSDSELNTVGFLMAAIDMGIGVGAATSCTPPEPDIVFLDPTDAVQLERLRFHCRYPQGLTAEQWAVLLQSRRQTHFVRLPRE